MPITVSSSPTFRAMCFVAGLILAGFAFMLARRSLTFTPELKAWDMLFRVRGTLPVRPDFALVAGDEKSIRELGPPQTWSRRVYADVVRALDRANPKTVVLDRFFEERDTARPASDRALWQAMANSRKVFLPVIYGNPDRRQITRDDLRGLIALEKSTVHTQFTRLNTTPEYSWLGFDPPVSDFAVSARGMGVSATQAGAADIDGAIRRTRTGWVAPIRYPASPPLPEPSQLSGSVGVVPGLPVIASMFTFNVDKEALAYAFGRHLLIGGSLRPPVFIPIDAEGDMTINYVGPAGTIPRYSLADVGRGQVDASTFTGKVVFIGLTSGSAEEVELLPTPFGPMPRVEITANAVHSILERNYLFMDPIRAPLGYLLAFGLVLGVVAPLFRPGIDAAVTLLLLLLYLVVAIGMLRVWHVLLPVVPAVLLAVLFSVVMVLIRAALGGGRTAAGEEGVVTE